MEERNVHLTPGLSEADSASKVDSLVDGTSPIVPPRSKACVLNILPAVPCYLGESTKIIGQIPLISINPSAVELLEFLPNM